MGPGSAPIRCSSTFALANLYYDFNVHPQLAPYLGAGIGFTINNTTNGVATDLGCAVACNGGFEGASSRSASPGR